MFLNKKNGNKFKIKNVNKFEIKNGNKFKIKNGGLALSMGVTKKWG